MGRCLATKAFLLAHEPSLCPLQLSWFGGDLWPAALCSWQQLFSFEKLRGKQERQTASRRAGFLVYICFYLTFVVDGFCMVHVLSGEQLRLSRLFGCVAFEWPYSSVWSYHEVGVGGLLLWGVYFFFFGGTLMFPHLYVVVCALTLCVCVCVRARAHTHTHRVNAQG